MQQQRPQISTNSNLFSSPNSRKRDSIDRYVEIIGIRSKEIRTMSNRFYGLFYENDIFRNLDHNIVDLEKYLCLCCIHLSYSLIEPNPTSLLRLFFQNHETKIVFSQFLQLYNCCVSILDEEELLDEDHLDDRIPHSTPTTLTKRLSHEFIYWSVLYSIFQERLSHRESKYWHFFIAYVGSNEKDVSKTDPTPQQTKKKAKKKKKKDSSSNNAKIEKRLEAKNCFFYYYKLLESFLEELPRFVSEGMYDHFQPPQLTQIDSDIDYIRSLFSDPEASFYLGSVHSLTSIKWVMINKEYLKSSSPSNVRRSRISDSHHSSDLELGKTSFLPQMNSFFDEVVLDSTNFLKNYFRQNVKMLREASFLLISPSLDDDEEEEEEEGEIDMKSNQVKVKEFEHDVFIESVLSHDCYFLLFEEKMMIRNLYYEVLDRIIETETNRIKSNSNNFKISFQSVEKLRRNQKFKKSLLFVCIAVILYCTGGLGKVKLKFILRNILGLEYCSGVKCIEFFVREVFLNKNNKKNIFGGNEIIEISIKKYLRYVEEKFFNYFLFLEDTERILSSSSPETTKPPTNIITQRRIVTNNLLLKKCYFLTHQKVSSLVRLLSLSTSDIPEEESFVEDPDVKKICDCVLFIIQNKTPYDISILYLDHIMLCSTYIIMNKFRKQKKQSHQKTVEKRIVSFMEIIDVYRNLQKNDSLKTPIELNKILFQISIPQLPGKITKTTTTRCRNVIQFYNNYFILVVKDFFLVLNNKKSGDAQIDQNGMKIIQAPATTIKRVKININKIPNKKKKKKIRIEKPKKVVRESPGGGLMRSKRFFVNMSKKKRNRVSSTLPTPPPSSMKRKQLYSFGKYFIFGKENLGRSIEEVNIVGMKRKRIDSNNDSIEDEEEEEEMGNMRKRRKLE